LEVKRKALRDIGSDHELLKKAINELPTAYKQRSIAVLFDILFKLFDSHA